MRGNLNQHDQKVIIQRIIQMLNERDKAMLIILGFFRHKMAAMTKGNVSHIKELISTHEISVSELVDRYVKFVYENS